MKEITPGRTRSFVMDSDEAIKLRLEIERIFIKADTESSTGCYSLKNMRESYPGLAQLFKVL